MSGPSRLLRCPAVLDRVGFSRTTIYRKIASNEFPAPIPIGTQSVAWLESEIEAWIHARVAACNQVEA